MVHTSRGPAFWLPGCHDSWCTDQLLMSWVNSKMPVNLVLKRMSPKIWLPVLIVAWGIVTMCLSFVRNSVDSSEVYYVVERSMLEKSSSLPHSRSTNHVRPAESILASSFNCFVLLCRDWTSVHPFDFIFSRFISSLCNTKDRNGRNA